MILPVEREAILPRVDGIRKNLKRLEELTKLSYPYFMRGDAYDLAQHHLRLSLEGIFHISSHILSRIPGERAVEYKEIARKMGEVGLVPRAFSDKKLVAMAGVRNILVHAYSDIDSKRLYNTIKYHRRDMDQFLKYIKNFLKNPKKFSLVVK